MVKYRFSLYLVILMLFSSRIAYAQDTHLLELQKKYSTFSSFTVQFTQELYNSETQESEKRSGTFTFKKPLLILWKTTTPVAEDIIVSQNEIWDYIPEDNIAFKYPIALLNDVAVFAYILSGQSNIEDNFIIKKTENNNGKVTLFLVPKKDHPSVTSLQLTLTKSSYEIVEVKIIDFYNNTNTIHLSNLTTNINVDNALFTFTPKEGVTVIDNSSDSLNE